MQHSAASVVPTGGRIDVAVTAEAEQAPKIALCTSNQYLVVYEYIPPTSSKIQVHGQRLDSSGALLGSPFRISSGDEAARAPDVACDMMNDRFGVVWSYDYAGDWSDLDLHAQSVYGAHQSGSSQLSGAQVHVSDVFDDDEQEPAVACNSDDATCLVAFEYITTTGAADIHGQRLSVGGSGLALDGDRFVVSDHPGLQGSADVAWGPLDENYLVVWALEYCPTASCHSRVAFCHVYDTEQGPAADERQDTPAFLINPGSWDYPQVAPAVAYNRASGGAGRYLVAFSVVSTTQDIGARRVHGTGAGTHGEPFHVTGTGNIEPSPAVAAAAGPYTATGATADHFVIVYSSDDWPNVPPAVYAQGVKGTHAASGSQLEGPAAALARSAFEQDWPYLGYLSVTGSPHSDRYAAVWWDTDQASFRHNVHGRLLSPYGTYLPLALSDP